MKETLVTVVPCVKSLYIPHGSDESKLVEERRHEACFLYIPHGSDESRRGGDTKNKNATFISHMVQMKEK